MLGEGGEIRNSHDWVLVIPNPVRTLAALLSAGRVMPGEQSTASELPDTRCMEPTEVARDFLGPGALSDRRFASRVAFLPCGGGRDMG